MKHSDAFQQAIDLDTYSVYDSFREEMANRSEKRSKIFNGVTFIAALFAIEGALQIIPKIYEPSFGIVVLALAVSACVSGSMLGKLVRDDKIGWDRNLALPAALLLLPLLIASLLQFFVKSPWDTLGTCIGIVMLWVATAIFTWGQSLDTVRELLSRPSDVTDRLLGKSRLSVLQEKWLNDAKEKFILPNMVLAIHTLLGKEYERRLVEQDSEGLRKLQDPMFRVSTPTREKLASLLSQMDGGSIALSGPRGAGKSTLLRQFTEPDDHDIRDARGLSVYVSAPSNYVARDFIAELLQRLCEGYLKYCRYPTDERLYSAGNSKMSIRRASRRILMISWLSLRVIAAITFSAWVLWIFGNKLSSAARVNLRFMGSWGDRAPAAIREFWNLLWPYFVLGVLVLALAFWPGLSTWRRYLWRRKESDLIKVAREYLLRLQIDKTVSRNASITSPGIRGIGLGLARGASAKYTPWTLPELVGYTRRFMSRVSQSESIERARRPVTIGIDEIDRIGALDQAEAFIGDIKAVFGVEKCYFLVSVAEDVGSLFAQRATAGRSILENAFDEVVTVGPLKFDEAQKILLKRVPGFTDSFAYLVYVLSGGLPRELIRVTRRLLEINLAEAWPEDYLLLSDLTRALVGEAVIEALDAARNQLSRLNLSSDWVECFDNIRSESASLREMMSRRSSSSKGQEPGLYDIVERISGLRGPQRGDWTGESRPAGENDQKAAIGILDRLSSFACFGITVIDAFSDTYFDLDTVKDTQAGSDGSYEQLAIARIELSVFAASARMILERFRKKVITGKAITDPGE